MPIIRDGKGETPFISGSAGIECYIQSLSPVDNDGWLSFDSNNRVKLSDEAILWKKTKVSTNPEIYTISCGDYWLAGSSKQWGSVWLTDEESREIYWRIIEMDNDPYIYSIEKYYVPDTCSDGHHVLIGGTNKGTDEVSVGCYSSNNIHRPNDLTSWRLFNKNMRPI